MTKSLQEQPTTNLPAMGVCTSQPMATAIHRPSHRSRRGAASTPGLEAGSSRGEPVGARSAVRISRRLRQPRPRPEALVREHARRVQRLARHAWRWRLVEREDLTAEGFVGLLEAGRRYRPEQGPFWRYAYKRVTGRMLEGARRLSHAVPAHVRHGVDITVSLRQVRPELASGSSESAGQDNQEASLLREQRHARLHAALAKLPPRQRLLLRRLFFGDCTLVSTAAELGLSLSSAHRLKCKALEALRRALTSSADLLGRKKEQGSCAFSGNSGPPLRELE